MKTPKSVLIFLGLLIILGIFFIKKGPFELIKNETEQPPIAMTNPGLEYLKSHYGVSLNFPETFNINYNPPGHINSAPIHWSISITNDKFIGNLVHIENTARVTPCPADVSYLKMKALETFTLSNGSKITICENTSTATGIFYASYIELDAQDSMQFDIYSPTEQKSEALNIFKQILSSFKFDI